MRLLLDTTCSLGSERTQPLPAAARAMIEEPEHQLVFSAASLWRLPSRTASAAPTFVPIRPSSAAACSTTAIPNSPSPAGTQSQSPDSPSAQRPFRPHAHRAGHRDGLLLLTVDPAIARYQGPIQLF